MPCNGITVLQMQLAEQASSRDEILALVKAHLLSPPITDKNRTIRMAVSLPLANGQRMPIKIAIELNGRVTAITQTGTFEVGKDVLQKWIQQLGAAGVTISGVKFESHTHDHHAPQLAYTAKQTSR